MATNISNRAINSSLEKMTPRFYSASECIPWLVVLITECLAIVILNIIAIIVFVKKRQLQRQSTYLIIHLAIVDLLAGAVSGPLQIERVMAEFCNLWGYKLRLTRSFYVKFAFLHLFSFTSLVNLVAISLDRLHATFCPFRHRCIEKWVYKVIIIVIWLTTTAREAAQIVVLVDTRNNKLDHMILYIPFYLISIFVICSSYILIVIKVRCSRHPQFHGATKRERKLTGTALIVSFVSLLCFLPALIYSISFDFLTSMVSIHVNMAVLITFLANSLINPAVYALRMPEFRAGVSQILCRAPKSIKIPADLPLRNLKGT